ncbi:hypothetical protein EXT64_16175 [Pectobacterium atrosepticum]|nr:hypothetical protein [Pectobacterium atrosepticum]
MGVHIEKTHYHQPAYGKALSLLLNKQIQKFHAISRSLTKSHQDKKAIVNHGLFCFMMEEENMRLTHIKWIFWCSVIQ